LTAALSGKGPAAGFLPECDHQRQLRCDA